MRCFANDPVEWAGKKISNGCKTPQHSSPGLASYRRRLRFCACAHSRSLPGNHEGLRCRRFPSLVDTFRLSAVFCSRRLFVHPGATCGIDCERLSSTQSTIRVGQNASRSRLAIWYCQRSIRSPSNADSCEVGRILQFNASCRRESHDNRSQYRLCFLNLFGDSERLPTADCQIKPRLLV
jgi:hypothetical protein